jgi:DNA-binding NarL/FixJ family response regulator
MTIRLAVIDGHTLTRCGLRQLIAQHDDIEIVCECPSAAQARAALWQSNPAVVIIDTVLPDADGLRLARELRDQDADLGIVVLSSDGGDDVLLRAMKTGVSAFVNKSAPVAEVLAAIRHSAVAAACFTASGLPDALDRRSKSRERFGLSPREMEVLRLLRDGLSIPAIAARMFIAPSTTKTYVARLYDKLGADNRAQALMIATHHGLIRYERHDASTSPGPLPVP